MHAQMMAWLIHSKHENKLSESFIMIIDAHHTYRDRYTRISIVLLVFRSAMHGTTGQTPTHILFDKELRLPMGLMFERPNNYALATEDYIGSLENKKHISRRCKNQN